MLFRSVTKKLSELSHELSHEISHTLLCRRLYCHLLHSKLRVPQAFVLTGLPPQAGSNSRKELSAGQTDQHFQLRAAPASILPHAVPGSIYTPRAGAPLEQWVMKSETNFLQEHQSMARKQKLSFPQGWDKRPQQETSSMPKCVAEEVERLRKVYRGADSEGDEEDEEEADGKAE